MKISDIAKLLIPVCAGALGSCALETQELPAEELYVRGFISKYGIPNIDHEWNMASAVKADIKVEGVTKGVVEVFTAPPGTPAARLAARLPISNGMATGDISLPAGLEHAYLQVVDNGNTIRTTKLASLSANALAGNLKVSVVPPDAQLPTVENYESSSYIVRSNQRDIYYEYLHYHAAETGDYSYTAASDWFKSTGRTFAPNPGNDWKANELYDYLKDLTPIPRIKMLSNLYYEMGEALSYRTYLSPIFDHYHIPGSEETAYGVFNEGKDNIERYFHNTTNGIKLDPEVTFRVHEEGPVTMQCIWRGTEFRDYFGYYYYKPGQEPTAEQLLNDIPKYTFLTEEDIADESTLTQKKTIKFISAASDTGDDEDGWINLKGMGTSNCSSWINHDGDDDVMIRGRKYYLAYFGENYNEEPTYTWPKDVQIGYFLFRKDKFYFSDCKLQYHLTWIKYGNKDLGPYGRPYAAKFRMQNRTYVGFGDESGDCDLNDVVFIAENVYPDPADITPDELEEDYEPDPDPEPDEPGTGGKPLSWTLACEDLGSTDDTDFNDIVIDVEYVAGSGKIKFIPRAAGGTLVSTVYFREGNNEDFTKVGEIHGLMSSQYATAQTGGYPMLNTAGNEYHVSPKTVKGITLSVPEDFVMTDFLPRVKITTRHYDESESDAIEVKAYTDIAGAGKIPQMLLLPEGWWWPVERTDITVAYPMFKEWVKDVNATDWINTKNENVTVSYR